MIKQQISQLIRTEFDELITHELINRFIEQCIGERNRQYVYLIKKHNIELYDFILSTYQSNKPLESVYKYVNSIKSSPICPICNTNKIKFINYKNGYQKYCNKKCADVSPGRLQKRKETNIKKYGHPSYLQSESGIEKRKQHCLSNYGVDHYSKTLEYKEKFKATMQDRYQCDYAMQSDELQTRYGDSLENNQGVRHPLQSTKIQKRFKETMKERYGAEYAMQSKELSELHRLSLQEHYQVDYPLQSKEVRETMKQTMIGRYGKEYSAQVDYIFDKVKQTNLDRYGVEFPIQNKEIFNAYKATCLYRYGVEFPFVLQDEKTRKRANVKRRETMEKEGKWIPLELISNAKLYYKQVIKYTNKQPLNLLENFEKRGLAGIEDAYHVDHKVSIKYGFENSIPPYIIGDIYNLEMLPWRDNVYKSSNCSIEPGLLFEKVNDYPKAKMVTCEPNNIPAVNVI